MRTYASGQDEPRDGQSRGTDGSRFFFDATRMYHSFGLRVRATILLLAVAVVGPPDASARIAPFDRADRAAARSADQLASLGDVASNVRSTDIVLGIPDASERLREQIQTAGMNAPRPEEPAEVPDAAPSRPLETNEFPDPETVDSNLPAQSLAWLGLFGVLGAGTTWWMSRRKARPSPHSRPFSPEEVRAALAEIAASKRAEHSRPSLGRPDLSVIRRSSRLVSEIAQPERAIKTARTFAEKPQQVEPSRFVAASCTEEARHSSPVAKVDRPDRAGESRSTTGSIRVEQVERIRSASSDLERVTRAESPIVHPAAGDDRLERIERSLLAFTDVVKNLVDTIPQRASLDRDPANLAGSVKAEGGIAAAPLEPNVPESMPEPEEELASAWERFLQSEGVEQSSTSKRKRTSGAARIARQGRARGAKASSESNTVEANSIDPSAETTPEARRALEQAYQSIHKLDHVSESSREITQSSKLPGTLLAAPTTGQGMPTDTLSDLARVREVVLELAGRGVPTDQICRAVALSPKEVGLILKSLFRANA